MIGALCLEGRGPVVAANMHRRSASRSGWQSSSFPPFASKHARYATNSAEHEPPPPIRLVLSFVCDHASEPRIILPILRVEAGGEKRHGGGDHRELHLGYALLRVAACTRSCTRPFLACELLDAGQQHSDRWNNTSVKQTGNQEQAAHNGPHHAAVGCNLGELAHLGETPHRNDYGLNYTGTQTN